MNNWGLAFIVVFEKLLHHEVKSFFARSKWPITIRPAGELIMSYNRLEIVIGIFNMNFPDFKLLLFYLFQQGQFILFFNHLAALSFLVRPVSVAFLPILLNQGAKHKDRCDVVFLNHSVKIIKCGSQRTLSSYNFLSFKFYDISIDIIFDAIFLLRSSQNRFRWVECHYMGISVVRELLWILVQFLQMVLQRG